MHKLAKPPTLGDRLDDLMWSRGDSCEELAERTGASAADVGRWADDRDVPGREAWPALAEYLDVDVVEVRRLVLRSQMRIVQRDLRRAPAHSGTPG